MSPSKRREMIRKDNTKLSLTRQCKLLKISRSSIYYTPVGMNAETLKLMHEIDCVFTKYPFFRCPAGHCAAMAREGAAAQSWLIFLSRGSLLGGILFVA
ncbi:hypothetical protein [Pseudorhodobacter turbinis]|uniref:hypothetical protein n=1 Tax=Pseudorhodobacter turbinis TaxID=2500533 RepID=UPI00269FEA2A